MSREIVLFLISCTFVLPNNGMQYNLTTSAKRWQEAEKECQSYGGSLATIQSDAEMNDLSSFMASVSPNEAQLWIGLFFECSAYYWSSGKPADDVAIDSSFIAWGPGENRFQYNDEQCVTLDIIAGHFADYRCSTLKYGICQYGNMSSIRTAAIDDCLTCERRLLPEFSHPRVGFNRWNSLSLEQNGTVTSVLFDANNIVQLLGNEANKEAWMQLTEAFNVSRFEIEAVVECNEADGFAVFITPEDSMRMNGSVGPNYGIDLTKFVGVAAIVKPRDKQVMIFVNAAANNIESFNSCLTYANLDCVSYKLDYNMGTKLTYQLRFVGQHAWLRICVAQDNCDYAIYYHKFKFGLANITQANNVLNVAIGAYSGSATSTVKVHSIKVYECLDETTTSTSTTASTTTSSPTTASTSSASTTSLSPSTESTTSAAERLSTSSIIADSIEPTTSNAGPQNQNSDQSESPVFDKLTKVAKFGSSDEEKSSSVAQSKKLSPSNVLLSRMFPLTMVQHSDPTYRMRQLLAECDHFAPYRTSPLDHTAIKFSLAVDALNEIDTVQEIISVEATLALSWSVDTCPILSTDVLTIKTPELIQVATSQEVWTPRFRFLTSSSSNSYMASGGRFGETMGEDFLATISQHENSPNRSISFYFIKSGAFSASCQLDLKKFPFDIQTCSFSFSLIRANYLVAIDYNSSELLWPQSEEAGAEWRFREKKLIADEFTYAAAPASGIHYLVTLERNPDYYVNNLIVPMTILAGLELGTYILPPNTADRPFMSMTILLAMTYSHMTILSNVPMTSQQILLLDFAQYLTWLSAACLIYQMVACCYSSSTKTRSLREYFRGRISQLRLFDMIAFFTSLVILMGLLCFFFKSILN